MSETTLDDILDKLVKRAWDMGSIGSHIGEEDKSLREDAKLDIKEAISKSFPANEMNDIYAMGLGPVAAYCRGAYDLENNLLRGLGLEESHDERRGD